MCLILFAYNAHPRYKLILAANRDEFYSRPTAPAGFWEDAPKILAGRDLVYNGTWLGITKNGRFSAVTNYRDPNAPEGVKSRGDLTKDFLKGTKTAENYLQEIEQNKSDYSGFNLLIGEFREDKSEFLYFSNRGDGIKNLSKGIYGLSNHLIDTNWHKVETGKRRFKGIVQKSDEIDSAELINILQNRTVATDEKLPNTGIGIERERILSPAFIETEDYGTRSSTVLLMENSGKVKFTEKTFIGTTGEVNYEFSVEYSYL
ncbi:NRDE family protein [soil metagenome]